MSRQGDPRLDSILTHGFDGDVVLVGFPFDEGCLRNNGRAGARFAPAAFRQYLHSMGPLANAEFGVDLRQNVSVSDAGDISPNLPLEAAHEQLTKVVKFIVQNNKIPFIVGGSNDQSAPTGKALLQHFVSEKNERVSVVNIDAHLDVRPLLGETKTIPHSGSPFRIVLEDSRFDGKDFCEFAIQGDQCAAEHAAFVRGYGGSVHWYESIKENPAKHFSDYLRSQVDAKRNIFVSFDIDAIRSADCPGVSCAATYGLEAADALAISMEAGRCPAVRCFDMSEMNPLVEAYRTPRLAVMMFYRFLLGVAMRSVIA